MKLVKMPALLPEYAIHTSMLMEVAENVALKTLETVKSKNREDLQILFDISAFHYLMCKIDQENFLKKYIQWINEHIPNIDFSSFRCKLGELVEKRMVKEYKELLEIIVSSLRPIN